MSNQRLAVSLAVAGWAAALLLTSSGRTATACPFCSAVQLTLTQELDRADLAVIAQLVEAAPDLPPDGELIGPSGLGAGEARFRIIDRLRGGDKLKDIEEIKVVYFGNDPPEKRFLITGIADIRFDWTTPLPLSTRAVDYVKRLDALPPKGPERLVFFQDFLQDEDPLLGQDAYDEFARSSYEDMIALGPQMPREQLIEWIDDPAVGPSGRRLYLTMLGVCGKAEDVAMLESLLRYDHSLLAPGVAIATAVGELAAGTALALPVLAEMGKAEEKQRKEGLDALLGCYLTLKGPDGLKLANQLYLGNPEADYRQLYSAIMALRVLGEETDVLPREDLIESMRLALDHPELADQVVPDLARWEDWDVMPRLVEMFKESPADDWIRGPVVSYLLVAAEQPGEVGVGANAALQELEKLDPNTVEQTRNLEAYSLFANRGAAASADNVRADGADAGVDGPGSPDEVGGGSADANSGSRAEVQVSGDDTPTEQIAPSWLTSSPTSEGPSTDFAPPTTSSPVEGSSDAPATAPAAAANLLETESGNADSAIDPPNAVAIIGVPLLAALVLFAVFAALLRSGDARPPAEAK
ncbi:MAG: hypothetical protein AAF961_01585 [Planctomycetota bacterium]